MEKVSWQEIRHEVAAVNPELASIIDKIDPANKFSLFNACYPFGTEILRKGQLYVPNSNGELLSLADSSNATIRGELDYNFASNPVSIILKNSAEIFMLLEGHSIPLYGLISPGKIFGTWKVLSETNTHTPAFLWEMTAGARSLFMLAKISEITSHTRLQREFNIRADKPKSLLEHWQIFRELAQNKDFGQPWQTNMLFFSAKWFQHLNDPSWREFYCYLLRQGWAGTEYWRNKYLWDMIFSLILRKKDIKANPYIVDTVKHLLAMSVGAVPGFAPAIDDTAGPISRLQEIYSTIYHLENYAPIIMQPQLFHMNGPDKPVYYSLEYPSTIEFSPRSRKESSKITDLYDINNLLKKCLHEIAMGELNIAGTPLDAVSKIIRFDCFHTNVSDYHELHPSSKIPLEDPSFQISHYDKNNQFPSNSAFVRGCIRIKHRT